MVAKSLAVAVVLVLASGCATTGGKHPTQTDEWIDQARAEGVFLEAPLRVSPQLRALVRDKVGYAGTEKARLLKLVRFLADADGLATSVAAVREAIGLSGEAVSNGEGDGGSTGTEAKLGQDRRDVG